MVQIIRNCLLLIFLISLQSCSGGIIGNFLETSFKETEEIKTKVELKNKSKKKKETEEIKTKIELKNKSKNKKNLKVVDKSKNKILENKVLRKRKYNPQSYKIIFILKDVDPKAPIEEISKILRNSDVNFEIEKIERFSDSDNNSLKK